MVKGRDPFSITHEVGEKWGIWWGSLEGRLVGHRDVIKSWRRSNRRIFFALRFRLGSPKGKNQRSETSGHHLRSGDHCLSRPNMVSIFDDDHSENKDRWITLGVDSTGTLLIVIHTFQETVPKITKIRIISARKADRQETQTY